MNNYVRLTFQDLLPGQADMLIAMLVEQGYDGFEERDNSLDAYIEEINYDSALLQQMNPGHDLKFVVTFMPAENWNSVWESNFHPVIIEDFVGIRASFHDAILSVKYEIIITPKMSFGTGHHATTSMMMREMKKIDFTGKRVFDFGTGTGILAILAEKLGAAEIYAVDNDEWSILNATENLENNNCTAITIQKKDTAETSKKFDIILANITKNIILENLVLLNQQLNKNGILLLSGILTGDENEMLSHCTGKSLQLVQKRQEGNWLCLKFLR